jgi:hypothetical protein
MRDGIMLFGGVFLVIIIAATMGFVSMWRDRHWK